jgi:hypothetical protein
MRICYANPDAYECDLRNVLDMQSEIARTVADQQLQRKELKLKRKNGSPG